MGRPTRWVTDTDENHSQWYIERFRTMAAEGVDLGGEARLLDAMLPPRSRVLDAGCGPGRVGALLHDRGHEVVGVDADPELITAAREDHPGPEWLVADLAELDLKQQGVAGPFAGAVLAGNVMAFVAPDTEEAVLTAIAGHLAPDGILVVGFGTDRGYPLADFDRHAATAGLNVEHRFATWDLRPWQHSSDFAVTVLRASFHETVTQAHRPRECMVNKSFRKYLTDAEVQLIEETKPASLAALDEDALGDLHNRVRRASSKYRKLHRRQASAQVLADGGRGKAAAKNPRSAVKAEVFEDALARVSRSLSKAAKASAAELKAERLAAARAGSAGPGRDPVPGQRTGSGRTTAKKRSPATKKKNAATLAAGARRQAKRDAR